MQADLAEVDDVGGGVLPGVEDHGELGVRGGHRPVSGDELIDIMTTAASDDDEGVTLNDDAESRREQAG